MKVRWSSAANRDLHDVWAYLHERSPQAAAKTIRRIEAVAAVLNRQPDIGRTGRKSGTRELVITRTPYIIVYRRRSDEVEVLSVLHGAQQWPPAQ